MNLKQDQEKVKALLSEAITVLCKNGLKYKSEINVEGLIGITIDRNEVVLVSVRETFGCGETISADSDSGSECSGVRSPNPSRKRKRRKHSSGSASKAPRVKSERIKSEPESKSQFEEDSLQCQEIKDVTIKTEPYDDDDIVELDDDVSGDENISMSASSLAAYDDSSGQLAFFPGSSIPGTPSQRNPYPQEVPGMNPYKMQNSIGMSIGINAQGGIDNGTIDSPVKPYICAQCGMRFAKTWMLTQHIRTHTGERPFPCTFCSGRFTQGGALYRHMKTCKNRPPTSCPDPDTSQIS